MRNAYDLVVVVAVAVASAPLNQLLRPAVRLLWRRQWLDDGRFIGQHRFRKEVIATSHSYNKFKHLNEEYCKRLPICYVIFTFEKSEDRTSNQIRSLIIFLARF